MTPLESFHRTVAAEANVVGILSWTKRGAGKLQRHREQYGLTFALLHDGPPMAIVRGSPTVLVLDKAGVPVAWGRGDCDWRGEGIVNLVRALAKR